LRRLFVINPRARGATEAEIRAIREYFYLEAPEFEHRVAESWTSARDQVRIALAEHAYDQVIALGGDGTVNAVANGFFDERQRPIRPEAALVVSRLGTGADYFRSVHEARPGLGRDDADWRETALRPEVRAVDLGLVRFRSEERAPLLFANALTAGITAEIVRLKGALPEWAATRLPKDLSYLGPTVLELLRNRAYRATLGVGQAWAEAQAAAQPRELVALFIAKGARLGSGMRISPRAGLSSGVLDTIAVSRMPVPKLLWKLRDLYRDGLAAQPGLERWASHAVCVDGAEALPLECDGEVQGSARFSVEVLPAALRVAFPMDLAPPKAP
jgi:diacylglycerol kinase family enzyme